MHIFYTSKIFHEHFKWHTSVNPLTEMVVSKLTFSQFKSHNYEIKSRNDLCNIINHAVIQMLNVKFEILNIWILNISILKHIKKRVTDNGNKRHVNRQKIKIKRPNKGMHLTWSNLMHFINIHQQYVVMYTIFTCINKNI